ncbi:MAG: hypothetical protein KDA86_19170 [Planctomycetaceae bacterium]|nr:hypothetical protein [Planctomycetaceae bacterium]
MRIRSVIQWTIILLLLIAGVGGYFAQQAWEQKDQLLLEGIRAEVANKAPDWDVGIEDAHIVNLQGQVRLTDISIKPQGEETAVLHIPECFIKIDPDLLFQQHKVLIRSLRISKPTLTLIRHDDGTWNWQKLGRPTPSDQTPEIEVEGGTFVVRVEAGVGLPQTEIASRDVALMLLPSGQRRFLIKGATQIEGAGQLAFEGKVNLENGAWELAGRAEGLDMSPRLLEKAAAISPAVKQQVAELSQQGVTITPGATTQPQPAEQGSLVQPVSQTRVIPGAPSQLSLPDLGLIANIGIDFALRSDGQQTIPEYRVLAKIMDGQVTEPLSPVPLSGLAGELLIENNRVIVDKLSAANGESKLSLAGEVNTQSEKREVVFDVEATNLWLDEEIRSVLPAEGKKLFDLINPSGLFTVKAKYDSRAEKPLQLDKLFAHNCQMRLGLFSYPVTNIQGEVTQIGDQLSLELAGIAADRPVALVGTVTNLGPYAETTLQVVADDFPMDRRITDALVSEKHLVARRALESLNLTGRADLKLQFTRPGGPGQKFKMGLDADVREASLNFNRFPYQVTNLSGHVHYNPWGENVWNFTELKGSHGPATLQGVARFDLTNKPGQFHLLINAENAPIDQDLQRAIVTASPHLQTAWNEINPTSGVVEIEGLEIRWSPGLSPYVTLPSVQLRQGAIKLASFPYRWDHVKADLAWKDGRVDIYRAEGVHDGTRAVIAGIERSSMSDDSSVTHEATSNESDDVYAAYFEMPTNEEYRWRLRLPDVRVTGLVPGPDYRSALPPDVAAVVNAIDPQGPLDLRMGLEVKSFPQTGNVDLVTSNAQLQIDLIDDRLFAGVDLEDVTGRVEANIIWDGSEVTADGSFDLDRARALDMSCTDLRGPFYVQGTRIIAGSTDVLREAPPGVAKPNVPPNEQITAKLYNGTIHVNAAANVDTEETERSIYQAQVDLKYADLSQWMTEWYPESNNITGTVFGQMNLRGRGSDPRNLEGRNCYVQITDTQLGELPVMAQMFSSLFQPQMRTVDKTAFRYAYADFSVQDGRFEFGRTGTQDPHDTRHIELNGSVLKMVGQGYVPFAPGVDRQMQLDFFSKVENRGNPLMSVPFVNTISRSFSDNWLHVRVTGTPDAPFVQTLPNVPLNNANDVLRGFVNTLEQGLNPVLPQPVPPTNR